MPKLPEKEYRRRIEEFLEAHKDAYTEREYDFIKRSADWGLHARNGFYITDIVRQVYAEVGLLSEEQNIYNGFISLLEENFALDRNIVEVAGGIIPSLAKGIALKQKTGTITVYDPRVMTNISKPDNLVLKRQQFNKNTQIPGANMIIGFMPCDATMDIVDSACKNNVDFMIALCEGGNRPGYEYLEDDEEWIGNVRYNAERGMEGTDMGTLETADLKKYGSPYPVIYNKRKKS